MWQVKQYNLSDEEKIVLEQIKTLTARNAYGNVVIVIRAGVIHAVQTSDNIVLSGKRRTQTDDSNSG